MTIQVRISLIILITITCCSQGIADSPALPQPYIIKTGDYIYVQHGRSHFTPEETRKRYDRQYYKYCTKPETRAHYLKVCETFEAIKVYLKPGLYRQGDPSRPLWSGGKCERANYISNDGEHVVKFGPWAKNVQQMAVSFCKRDKLIAEYIIDDLITDPKELVRSTSHFFWKSETKYDAETAILFLKTVDQNEYWFDARTGKIIKHDYTPIPVYNALVGYKVGGYKVVRDFRSCAGMAFAILMQGTDYPIHELQVVDSVKKEKVGERVSLAAIHFRNIESLRFVEQTEKGRLIWQVKTRDGARGQVLVNSTRSDFCGEDNEGNRVSLSAADIRELKLGRDKSVPETTSASDSEKKTVVDLVPAK